MSDQEFQRAMGYASVAIELLRRSGIPPYPPFYELLYTYATGVDPALNARINAIFRDGEPSTDMVETLYNEFLKSNDQSRRISNVSERVSRRIDAVYEVIDAAISNATSYSGSLTSASGDLGRSGLGPEALRDLTRRLLDETKRMQDANSQLEQKLQTSREDIAQLQHDLDTVRQESMLDPLTKLYNRRTFDGELRRAIRTAIEREQPMCLMLLDIDHFKRFNDIYGHQTGDQVLRLVAMVLKANIKGKDLAARYGGEEFVIIMPATGLDQAISVGDAIRRTIQSKELLKRSTKEKLGRITASIGVAMLRHGDTASSLIERADQCLYAAKGAGRNCVYGERALPTDRQVGVAAA